MQVIDSDGVVLTAVTDEVYLVRLPWTGCWTGVTLVLGDTPILIDSGGVAGTVDSTLVPALAQVGLRLSDIEWVLATHMHGDHIGGIARMRGLAPSIRVGVLRDSVDRMRDPLAYSRQIRARFPDHSPEPPPVLDGVAPDLLLDDGDMVGPLVTLHTPGHDTDSCCFLDSRTATLITGDSLQSDGTVAQGCGLLFDPVRYRASLDRLLGMSVQNIVCGHPFLPHGELALGEQASRDYLLGCVASHERDRGFVAGMAAAGVTDVETIARALVSSIDGTLPDDLFIPMHTVAALLQAAPEGSPAA